MRASLSIVLLAGLRLYGCRPAPEEPIVRTLAIVGATIIDGTAGPPILDGVLLIEGDRIAAVGSADDVEIPEDADVVPARERWIIPGMIDLHMHFWESGRPGAQPTYVADVTEVFPYENEVQWMKRRAPVTLGRYLCSGVTTVVVLGAIPWEYEVRELAEEMEAAPRVVLAGGFIGNSPPEDSSPFWEGAQPGYWIADPQAARGLVEELEATGVELIKAGYVSHPEYTLEAFQPALSSLIEESHKRGLRVAVHANELESAKMAMQAGADILAHTVRDRDIDAAFIDLALAAGVVNTSTAGLPAGHARLLADELELTEAELRCADPEVVDAWEQWMLIPRTERPDLPASLGNADQFEEQMIDNLQQLHAAGVRIGVGSDGGNIGSMHGPSFQRELNLLARAGLDPMKVIVAATRIGAEALGREHELGTLETGKLADAVVLDSDPLADVANLVRVHSVIVRGKLITVDELRISSDE